MSAGWSSGGDYTFASSYIDKIVKDGLVIWVGSAGNDDTNGVVSPATGVNSISVASLDKDLDISEFSSTGIESSVLRAPYIASAGGNLINIPDISNDIFDEFFGLIQVPISGTSFSGPVVTGIIALLMEEYQYLRVNPSMVVTAITASANQLNGHINPWDPDGGAGRVNYQRAKEICANINFNQVSRNFGNSGSIAKSMSVTIPQNTSVVFTAHNMYNSIFSGSTVDDTSTALPIFTKYKLELVNSLGKVVSSDTGNSNIFKIRYTNYNSSTNFTLRLKQVGGFLTTGTDVITFAGFGVDNIFNHTFTYSQISNNNLYHLATCSCGFSFIQEHHIVTGFPQLTAWCDLCGYQIF